MVAKDELHKIYQMRSSGATLQQIAVQFSLSRERVRQLLVKYYGSTKTHGLLDEADVSRLSGCARNYILKLRRRGIIRPAQVIGKGRTLWTPDAVDSIVEWSASHRCRVCDGPLPNDRWAVCSAQCRIESSKHKNRPLQVRKRHNERVAMYVAKKSVERYHNTEYIIRGKCPIPLGTVVKVKGRGMTPGRLEVEYQGQIIEVNFGSVRRCSTVGLSEKPVETQC